MAVSEADRHELYSRLEDLIGEGPTETMMALLPPVGWADVATKRDLDRLETKLEAVESRLNERMWRIALTVNIPTVIAAVGLSFAAARLA